MSKSKEPISAQDKQNKSFALAQLELQRNVSEMPNGWVYAGINDLLVKEGSFYSSEPLNNEEFSIVEKALDSLYFVPQYKQCFYNAQQLVLLDSSNQIKYVEGLVNSGFIPLLHGFAEINGKVIDITYRRNKNDEFRELTENYVLGTFPEGWSYWGLVISREDVSKRQIETGQACSHLDDYQLNYPLLKRKYFEPKK